MLCCLEPIHCSSLSHNILLPLFLSFRRCLLFKITWLVRLYNIFVCVFVVQSMLLAYIFSLLLFG